MFQHHKAEEPSRIFIRNGSGRVSASVPFLDIRLLIADLRIGGKRMIGDGLA